MNNLLQLQYLSAYEQMKAQCFNEMMLNSMSQNPFFPQRPMVPQNPLYNFPHMQMQLQQLSSMMPKQPLLNYSSQAQPEATKHLPMMTSSSFANLQSLFNSTRQSTNPVTSESVMKSEVKEENDSDVKLEVDFSKLKSAQTNTDTTEETRSEPHAEDASAESSKEGVDKVSLSEKNSKVIKYLGHDERKHYAKGLCNQCYHKKSREKKPTLCPHESLYARGLCQNCYGLKYKKGNRRSSKLRTRYSKF
eukprot:CAMPEP_0176448848 /NCGR_PEP_ID=MMETSP0127-20121128/26073_1 /TAXON_ID=938130 /ORGANISM="Platyophrya macrostoma, Strain WH" /LENGTH=247 /DNA_ID=CAMNT_0017835967 /DNA_START=16 /DNA_END=760 /DNA_ORIENTATION=+